MALPTFSPVPLKFKALEVLCLGVLAPALVASWFVDLGICVAPARFARRLYLRPLVSSGILDPIFLEED